jgi:hypothetical protein
MAPHADPPGRDERRRLERFDLQAPARIEIQLEPGRRDVVTLTTRDISSMGAFVRTAEPLEEGSAVKLELLLSMDLLRRFIGEKGKAKIRVRGTVVRTDSEGMAIEFDSRYKISATGGASFE